MAVFITDRTQSDIDITKQLVEKVRTNAWDSLTVSEQSTYLSISQAYEDRGRFSQATADRVSSYLREITDKLITEPPYKLPTTVEGRSVGAWGSRNFRTDPDFPGGTLKTFAVANVNTTTDEVTLTAHGFTVTQWYRVKYTTSSTTLGGLTNGNYYNVYIKDANTVSFLYGGVGVNITSKPASGSYTLEFITAPYMPISRDDFQCWVDILTVAYGGNPTGWAPIASPYLDFETLNSLETNSEAILAGTITSLTEYSGTYMTGDELLVFDEYI